MSSKWRNTSVKIVLILFVVCIMIFAFSFVNHTTYTGKSFAEAYNLPVGQSMFAGDSILDQREMIEVPLLSNPGFIFHEISTLDLRGLLFTLTTGYVPFDFSGIVSQGIDSYGNVYGFKGPGYLVMDGDKLAVKAPDNYIWGYSSPYKVLTKTNKGVDVVENGTVIESVPTDKIKDLNFRNDFYNSESSVFQTVEIILIIMM